MWDWLKAAEAIHALLAILAAIGCFHFAVWTRFWLPRYVHYLGGVALALGLTCVALTPPDTPITSGWVGLAHASPPRARLSCAGLWLFCLLRWPASGL